MEAIQRRSRADELRRFVGTRRGAVTVAASTTALAALVLLAFMSQYKQRVQSGTVDRAVLVADRLVPKGTSGAVAVSGGFFKPSHVQEAGLAAGALTSAAAG